MKKFKEKYKELQKRFDKSSLPVKPARPINNNPSK